MIGEVDLKEVDQTGWLAFDLGAGTYYYGQVSYLDAQGALVAEPTATFIKHGNGIYVYDCNLENPSRYQGSWSNDLKHGQGKMVYNDGSAYLGGWKDGKKSKQGKMSWSNGDQYEGGWKGDLMDGLGIFRGKEGTVLKGNFKCNYFIEGEGLRNPFLNEQEAREFSDKRKNLEKIKEKVSKQQLGFFQRVKEEDFQAIQKLIVKSNLNNRVPLILPSTEVQSNLSFLNRYSETTKQPHQIFDLRKAYVTPPEARQEFNADLSTKLVNVLKNNGLLVISLDQSDCHYTQKFYPNIKEFYNPSSFPGQVWSKVDLSRKEVYQKLCPQPFDAFPDFGVALWSKYRIPQSLDNKQAVQKLQKRLETVIPLLKVDYIFLVR